MISKCFQKEYGYKFYVVIYQLHPWKDITSFNLNFISCRKEWDRWVCPIEIDAGIQFLDFTGRILVHFIVSQKHFWHTKIFNAEY